MSARRSKPEAEKSPDDILVRIKPYNPKKGHVRKSYSARGVMIFESRGWHEEIPEDLHDYLREVRQKDGDESTPLAFDVVTRAEAMRIDAREAAVETERRAADSPMRVHHAGRQGERVASAARPTPRRTPSDVLTTEDLGGAEAHRPAKTRDRDEPAPKPGHEFDDLEREAGIKPEQPRRTVAAAPAKGTPGKKNAHVGRSARATAPA